MPIFYQQSGKRGEQDFTKTLVQRNRRELRHFKAQALRAEYDFNAEGLATDLGFQIWGVPAGAKDIFRKMQVGDIVLLIGHLPQSALEYGKFFYSGRIVYISPREEFDFSKRLWGDGGFPLIFFMQGVLVDYSWLDFLNDFHFNKKYFNAGKILPVPPARLAKSVYRNEVAFSDRLGLAGRSRL